jgi:hypothetical protein
LPHNGVKIAVSVLGKLVISGLGVVVGALPADGVPASNRQPSESNLVQDHVRLRHHQIVAIAYIGVRIRTRDVKHAGTAQPNEATSRWSGSSEFSPGGGSAEMISDRCSDANRKV